MNIYVFERRNQRRAWGLVVGAVVVAVTREQARKTLADAESVSTDELKKEFDVQLLSRYTGGNGSAFVVLASSASE